MGRKKRPAAHHGVLLVDKAQDWTSHDVVNVVRRKLGQRQVGHTGTLDPMATGLLVVALGRATRLARFIEATQKRYVGRVTLGRATTTYDAEGETTEEADVPAIGQEQLERALASLRGRIRQTPPIYSAIKVDGERLYKKARRGEAVDVPSREVEIFELSASRFEGREIDIVVECSKGTYIRSLAVQIGEALGVPAHLSMLRRTGIGDHRVADAVSVDDVEPSVIRPVERAVDHLPAIHLNDLGARDIAFGRPLRPGLVARLEPFEAEAPVRVHDPAGTLRAIAHCSFDSGDLADRPAGDTPFRYACVLPVESKPEIRVDRSGSPA